MFSVHHINGRGGLWGANNSGRTRAGDRIARAAIEALEPRRLLTVFFVTNTGDNGGINPAVGAGTGTLRQAIIDSNANTHPPLLIDFSIGSGAQTIELASQLPTITHPVVINGESQPGYAGTPLIELNGAGLSAANGLTFGSGAAYSTVEGLAIYKFVGTGIVVGTDNVTVIGNYIGGANEGNSAGIVMNDANNDTIGGGTAAARNVIAGNHGPDVTISYGTEDLVSGNYIGTNPAGTAIVGGDTQGILINDGAEGNIIGGITAGARNVISGPGVGVEIDGTKAGPQTASNIIEGNYIGTDDTGALALGNGEGVLIDSSAADNTIGGGTAGAGNVIAFNTGSGVSVGSSAADNLTVGNEIRLNSIFGNGGLGIDLGSNGVTPNSPGGPHSGPNDLQNNPFLSSAVDANGSIIISGSLEGAATNAFLLDFYSNPALGPSGTLQGRTYLGTAEVSTDGTGYTVFNVTLPVTVLGDTYVTATATSIAKSDTSEFAAPVEVGGSFSGTQSAAAASYNLTALGTTDWAHWGLGGSATAFDHKATGGSQISNVTRIGSGNFGGYSDPSRTVSWSDGTPLASDAGDHGYIWANDGIGAGYSFTVPASTTPQTLYVYLGGYSSGSTLTASLSDGSGGVYTASFSGSASYTDIVAITFKTAETGQTLKLSYVKSQNINGASGSADLIAAWLGGPAIAPNVITSPTNTIVAAGATATFTAAAGGSPVPSVQWQISTNGGTTFTNIAGATSTTYSFTAAAGETGDEYQAVFTNSAGNATTAPAVLSATGSSGSLSSVASTASSSYNLTALGTSDWAHWGTGNNASAFDHKSTGGSQISNVTRIGSGGFGAWYDPSRKVSWTDGAPLASDSGDNAYIWANNGIGAGYSFTVPAGTTARTVYVFLGGYSSGSTLTAHLSDGSAADLVVNYSGSALYSYVVAITYRAASAGQTLTLSYVKSQNINGASGSADLIAAWLA